MGSQGLRDGAEVSVRNWEPFDWFMVAMGTIMVLGLAFHCGGEAIDWLDQRSCRNRGGTVDHHDPDHHDAWRCVGGTVER